MIEQSQSSKTKVSPGLSVGGASTAIIAAYNAWGDPTNAAFVVTAVPVIVGALFWLSEYAFCAFGFRSLDELRVLRGFDHGIKDLEKRMKKAQELGYSQSNMDALKDQHYKLVVARSEVVSNASKIEIK
ncbi:hypothetical protein OP256_001289 [Vibrio parahaemolyticus]|nr:hypothetical protein [Vibrio parahaemolyticus]